MKKTIKRWTAGVLVAAITFSGPVMPAEAKGKLAKPEIKQVTSESAGKLKVLYKKVPKQAKAQVQVSTDKKFKKNVRSKVARGTVKSITFKKLKTVTYYVRVRSFVTEKKKKKYSTWSSKKKISVTGAKTSTDTTEAEDTAADTGRTGTYPRTEEDLIRPLAVVILQTIIHLPEIIVLPETMGQPAVIPRKIRTVIRDVLVEIPERIRHRSISVDFWSECIPVTSAFMTGSQNVRRFP